jgi:hypothetical protein
VAKIKHSSIEVVQLDYSDLLAKFATN